MASHASIHGRAVEIVAGDEDECPYDCSYCLVNSEAFQRESAKRKGTTESVMHEARQLIEEEQRAMHTVFASREHEILSSRNRLSHIRRLMGFGMHVSILSKTPLRDDAVDDLVDLDRQHFAQCGRRIVVEYSLPSGRNVEHLEPNVPSVESRIDSVRRMAAKGLPVGVCIGPLVPPPLVSDQDVYSLVDQTCTSTPAFTLRPLDYTLEIASRMGMDTQSPEVRENTLRPSDIFTLKQDVDSEWLVYENRERRAKLARYIRNKVCNNGFAHNNGGVPCRAFRNSQKAVPFIAETFPEPS